MLPRGVMNKMNKLVSSGRRHNISRQYFLFTSTNRLTKFFKCSSPYTSADQFLYHSLAYRDQETKLLLLWI